MRRQRVRRYHVDHARRLLQLPLLRGGPIHRDPRAHRLRHPSKPVDFSKVADYYKKDGKFQWETPETARTAIEIW